MEGARRPQGWVFVGETEDGVFRTRSFGRLAKRVAPIETLGEALGLAALRIDQIWVPGLTGDPQKEFHFRREDYDWTTDTRRLVEPSAERHDWGWILQLPAVRSCGCRHDLVEITVRVDRRGSVCEVDRSVRRLAFGNSVCVD